ncbi:MAG: carboxymuconolactone decarboxylase family protein [Lentimicrobiaceae bacterium]|nr:carboxymuconolactone decarboxylase family protein [Lentimicrobiaceae bacterium]
MKFEIPESLARSEFKRKFSFIELYRSYIFVPRAILKLKDNKKSGLVDLHFIERLQLAVTEVNGCAVCSYAHTTMALRQGMSNEEISSFLSGSDSHIKPEEAKAIMFAQHFADTRGYPQEDTYEAIVAEYGSEKAGIILSAVQVMLAGNMFGIPFSAYLSRRNGKPFKGSSLWYEMGMLIGGILVLPIAMIHALLRWMPGLPNTRYGKKTEV